MQMLSVAPPLHNRGGLQENVNILALLLSEKEMHNMICAGLTTCKRHLRHLDILGVF